MEFQEKIVKAYTDWKGFDFEECLGTEGFEAFKQDIPTLLDTTFPFLTTFNGHDVNLDSIWEVILNANDKLGTMAKFFPNFAQHANKILNTLPEKWRPHFMGNLASISTKYHLMHVLEFQDIYAVSEKTMEQFANPKVSEKFKIEQIINLLMKLNYPMLFVFETGLVVSVQYFNHFHLGSVIAMDVNYGHHQYRVQIDNDYAGKTMPEIFSLIEDAIKEREPKYGDIADIPMEVWTPIAQAHVVSALNLMLFMVSKDTTKIHAEFNPKRIKAQERLAQGIQKKKQRKRLAKYPEYKFVDMGLSIDRYTKTYRSNKKTTNGTPKKPHWRDAHHHPYWVGTGSKKRLELRYIPDIWIGDPALMTPKPLKFKVPKLR
jgi:hypothetical protein